MSAALAIFGWSALVLLGLAAILLLWVLFAHESPDDSTAAAFMLVIYSAVVAGCLGLVWLLLFTITRI